MEELTKHFPVTQEYTYLNTASCGLLSKPLVTWRHQHDVHLLEGGSLFRDQHKTHIREIRRSVSRFFTSEEEEVALVPNFSFGMNVVLDGLGKGQRVLLLKGDYPSVNWPFERRDFDLCFAEIDAHLEQNISEAIEKYHPDILALSIVQYISGIKIDLDFIKTLKLKYPNLLIIGDGTQYMGTECFNFANSGFDVIGASCYKWMLSGYGNGFFLIKKEAQKRIHPDTVGFNSADAKFSKKNDLEFVGHLEPGHQDTLNYGSLGASIQWMEELGKEKIEKHLAHLSSVAKVAFESLGLLDSSVMGRVNHSTIFNCKGDAHLFQKLKDNAIICSLRGQGIRFSFHIYNTESDLNTLVELLKE